VDLGDLTLSGLMFANRYFKRLGSALVSEDWSFTFPNASSLKADGN
jgi:hypothetical protein